MIRNALAIIAFVTYLGACGEDDNATPVIKGEIMQYGVYQNSMTHHRLRHDSTAVGFTSIGESKLLYKAAEATFQKGQGVGFDYQITVNRIDRENSLNIEIHHPEIVGKDGRLYRVSKHSRELPDKPGTYKSSLVYFFNDKREMVPGNWSLQIYYKHEILLEKEFKVVF